MKRILLILIATLSTAFSTCAMGYEEAKEQAWFLTDKMAYELNLTPEQYDRAYQINLDYLMSIRTASDCYGNYWTYRNADFRNVLFSWQYSLYSTLDYFFRPIRWMRSAWYFPVFDHYRRGYFYFARPTVYVSYHGHGWHKRRPGDRSPYHGMHFRPGTGMRDYYRGGNNRPPHHPEYGRPGNADNRRPDTSRPGHIGRTDRGNGHAGKGEKNNRLPHTPGRTQGGHPSTTRPSTGRQPNTGSGKGNRGTITNSRNTKTGARNTGTASRNGNRQFGRTR